MMCLQNCSTNLTAVSAGEGATASCMSQGKRQRTQLWTLHDHGSNYGCWFPDMWCVRQWFWCDNHPTAVPQGMTLHSKRGESLYCVGTLLDWDCSEVHCAPTPSSLSACRACFIPPNQGSRIATRGTLHFRVSRTEERHRNLYSGISESSHHRTT